VADRMGESRAGGIGPSTLALNLAEPDGRAQQCFTGVRAEPSQNRLTCPTCRKGSKVTRPPTAQSDDPTRSSPRKSAPPLVVE
jgi:hypothetical protein